MQTGLFDKVYVFCEEELSPIPGIQFVTIPRLIRKIRPLLIKRIVRIIYEPFQIIIKAIQLKPVIINGYYILPKGLNSFIASRFSKSFCIMSLIGGKEEIETSLSINSLSRFIIINLLKSADFVTTKGLKDNQYLIEKGINPKKISVFNGAIDITKFCYKGEPKDIDILFSGYFDRNKGPQRALEIVNKVIAVLKDLNVVFIGKGPIYKDMIKLSEQMGLSVKVKFKGFVDNPEYYYRHAKVLVFPSANEGLSTAMLEAMACRCVPITSDVGNQTEAAMNNVNSIVISEYTDIDSFSFEIIKLLQDNDRRSELAINAERTISDKYTSAVQANLYRKICSQFIEEYEI